MAKYYYIAYGSNLNKSQMAYRCPGASVYGTAVLEGWQLLYRGSKTGAYLTIEEAEDCCVPVAVWEVSTSNIAALDRYEGYPAFYYRQVLSVTVKRPDGNREKVEAFVYIMHEDREYGIPSDYYVEVCEQGYRDFGFDDTYLHEAFTYSAGKKLLG